MELTTPDTGRGWTGELRAALGCGAAVALAGAPVGLAWSALAPRPDVLASPRGLDVADTETKDFIAADGSLFLLCLAAGLVAGALAWRLARRHALGALVGTVLGSGLAAWVAYRTGVVGEDRAALVAAAQQGRLSGPADLPLQLRSRAVLFAWPGAAALAVAVLAFRAGGPPRRRRRFSSG